MLSIDALNDYSKDELLTVQAEILGYKRMPVSIRTFIEDEYYLGKMFGDRGIYEYWMDVLETIYPTPIHTAKPFVIFTGPIGTGKSTIVKIAALYLLHRLDCLDNYDYFGIVLTKTIDWMFFHTSAGKAQSDLINSCWLMYESSPYFTSEFQWNGARYNFVADGPRSKNAVGGDVIFYHFSEVNFVTNYYDMKHRIDQSFDRLKSRFLKVLGYFGNIFIDSSAAGDEAIVDYIIREYPMDLLVIREPIWVVKKSLGIYFKEGSFKVYTGDSTNPPFIIEDDKVITEKHDPDKILEVPKELEDNYRTDLILALQNSAGVSTMSNDVFFRETDKIKNSFVLPSRSPDTILADFYDEEEYWDLLKDQILEIPQEKILFIGIDLGITGDLAGLAISYFDDWVYKDGKKTIDFKTKTPLSVGISRKPGQETNITKIYNLIWSIAQMFEIGAVNTDQYQSTQLRQDLNRESIPAYLVSVDRTRDPYVFYKHQIYKGLHQNINNELLKEEQMNLIDTGWKVDHLTKYSKDLSDAVVSSVFAIKSDINLASQISAKYSFKNQMEALRHLGSKQDIKSQILNNRRF